MMFGFPAGQIAFLDPWILAGLLALPLLWFLLRVFPPAPRIIRLPGAWLLDGLVPDDQTTSKTPWWLLLLRTVLAALILLALAQPVINPAESLNIQGNLRIVMENGWAASQTWAQQRQAADNILDRAARDRREVYIMTTAPDPGQTALTQQGPMSAAQAETILRGLKPRPWPSLYSAAVQTIETSPRRDGVHSFWIGTGLDDGGALDLAKTLQRHGGLTYMEPEAGGRPLLLLSRLRAGQNPTVAVSAASGFPDGFPVTIEAIGTDGRVLDQKTERLQSGKMPMEIALDLPEALRGQIGQIRIGGRGSAGTVILLDDIFNRRMVGLASARDEGETAPLVESDYYIKRALETTSDLHMGQVDELLAIKGLSIIILPDVGALPPATLEALEKWVRKGGLLLRFAGPNMSQADNFLTPIPLRKGERALDGTLTWEKPQKIAPFPKSSPLYGLEPPADVEVRQQLLAEPVANLEKMSWATLEDGTPLITAAPLDRGMIVLVHTTATPQWSNLALSGLYVQMLKRIVSLAGMDDMDAVANGMLQPLSVLDGRGAMNSPDGSVLPIDAQNSGKQAADSSHPPGIYGRESLRRAFNIGDHIKSVQPIPDFPVGIERNGYKGSEETDLMPLVLTLAMILFLADWIVMLVLQGFGSGRLRMALRSAAVSCLILCSMSVSAPMARAQDLPGPSADDIRYASAIHLAFMQSGHADVDEITRKGLQNLADTLTQRTSVEPAGVAALDPEKNDLSFFPLIYWPVTAQQPPLSEAALRNVQSYLDHGGTILFDTRDDNTGSGAAPTLNAMALRALTSGLDVPPLALASKDHVLTKSFYLIRSFPGRYDNATLWVEEQSASGRDGVSSVLVGSNDWASAWAGIAPADGTQQHEMAMRFGVNLMMYALTGNYKADQVH
ncbi:MAG TPA: DUF4159 domain-containing protein, partial [Micavibrio sp.]